MVSVSTSGSGAPYLDPEQRHTQDFNICQLILGEIEALYRQCPTDKHYFRDLGPETVFALFLAASGRREEALAVLESQESVFLEKVDRSGQPECALGEYAEFLNFFGERERALTMLQRAKDAILNPDRPSSSQRILDYYLTYCFYINGLQAAEQEALEFLQHKDSQISDSAENWLIKNWVSQGTRQKLVDRIIQEDDISHQRLLEHIYIARTLGDESAVKTLIDRVEHAKSCDEESTRKSDIASDSYMHVQLLRALYDEYALLDQHDKAKALIPEIEKAAKYALGDWFVQIQTLTQLASCYDKAGNASAKEATLSQAYELALNEDSMDAGRINLGIYLLELGDTERARSLLGIRYNDILEKYSKDNLRITELEGRIQTLTTDEWEEFKQLEDARITRLLNKQTSNQDYPEYWLYRRIINAATYGDLERAQESYQEAERLFESNNPEDNERASSILSGLLLGAIAVKDHQSVDRLFESYSEIVDSSKTTATLRTIWRAVRSGEYSKVDFSEVMEFSRAIIGYEEMFAGFLADTWRTELTGKQRAILAQHILVDEKLLQLTALNDTELVDALFDRINDPALIGQLAEDPYRDNLASCLCIYAEKLIDAGRVEYARDIYDGIFQLDFKRNFNFGGPVVNMTKLALKLDRPGDVEGLVERDLTAHYNMRRFRSYLFISKYYSNKGDRDNAIQALDIAHQQIYRSKPEAMKTDDEKDIWGRFFEACNHAVLTQELTPLIDTVNEMNTKYRVVQDEVAKALYIAQSYDAAKEALLGILEPEKRIDIITAYISLVGDSSLKEPIPDYIKEVGLKTFHELLEANKPDLSHVSAVYSLASSLDSSLEEAARAYEEEAVRNGSEFDQAIDVLERALEAVFQNNEEGIPLDWPEARDFLLNRFEKEVLEGRSDTNTGESVSNVITRGAARHLVSSTWYQAQHDA